MQPDSPRYTRIAVALHWIVAMLLLAQLALGWWMLELPKSPPGLRAGWFNVHKSIGIVLFMVVLLRLAWRTAHLAPGHDALPAWQRHAAQATHALLYACMLVLPLSGYLGSSFSGYPVRFFGIVLPEWTAAWAAGKQFMSSLHFATVCVFMGLIALHTAAGLWHWLWRRDEIGSRMGLPRLSRG